MLFCPLCQILPTLNQCPCFALKGGTAINLFIQNMPRLSVDIDLNYLPIEPRDKFLLNLTKALDKLTLIIQKTNKDISVTKKKDKLNIRKNDTKIIIEPNLVFRGYVFEPAELKLCSVTQNQFLQSFKIKSMSKADLYGGKICAALSRQHPRDLFDIKLLMEHDNITDDIRKSFVIYLASGSRPMHELLNPNLIDISDIFFKEFEGMTNVSVTLDELLETRKQLIKIIKKDLTENERLFLLSIKQNEPDWDLINLPHIQQLPAIQWKLKNIQKMDHKKQKLMIEKLKKVLLL